MCGGAVTDFDNRSLSTVETAWLQCQAKAEKARCGINIFQEICSRIVTHVLNSGLPEFTFLIRLARSLSFAAISRSTNLDWKQHGFVVGKS